MRFKKKAKKIRISYKQSFLKLLCAATQNMHIFLSVSLKFLIEKLTAIFVALAIMAILRDSKLFNIWELNKIISKQMIVKLHVYIFLNIHIFKKKKSNKQQTYIYGLVLVYIFYYKKLPNEAKYIFTRYLIVSLL